VILAGELQGFSWLSFRELRFDLPLKIAIFAVVAGRFFLFDILPGFVVVAWIVTFNKIVLDLAHFEETPYIISVGKIGRIRFEIQSCVLIGKQIRGNVRTFSDRYIMYIIFIE